MHTGHMKLNTIAVTTACLGLFACSSNNALATDSVQIGHFSVPAASQGWPYVAPTVAPAQIFNSNTTSDTTNPVNWMNPASVAGAGFNPTQFSPTSTYASSIPYAGTSSPYFGGYGGGYGGGYRSGIPFVGSGFSPLSRVPFLGGGFGIPFVGSIPYVGSIGSFGLPFLGGSFGGFGGGWGGGRGWSNISSFSPFNYGGFGGYGGYGGFANPAAYMGGFRGFGGGAHQGPVGNRVIQTGPSPSSGNYYQPATADPGGASGGYYESGSTSSTPPAAPPTKNQPKNYYDSYGTDNNWGGGGSPLPKDLNSVPWAK